MEEGESEWMVGEGGGGGRDGSDSEWGEVTIGEDCEQGQ